MTPSRKHQHHTHGTYENMDQSWRHARPHRRSRTGDHHGRGRCLCQVLQDLLQCLRQVLGRQVRLLLQELLQVSGGAWRGGGGAEKVSPRPLLSLHSFE